MDFIFGVLFGWSIAGVVYWLYIHGKLPGIEQRIKDFIRTEIDSIRRGTHP